MPSSTYVLARDVVQAYVAAVGDGSTLYQESDLVPPTALAALALRSILEVVTLPPGTMHGGQELQFLRAMRTGQRITCQAQVAHNSTRAGSRFLAIDLDVRDEGGEPVLHGRSTIIVPGERR
ncbi:MAG: MaoC family dehydratase N-terminal domain-containing protein [Chloroflexi bacterium]|nr:MaoC family dehydratase N-terminal domain-containing protein [Chloroflexota bacterium]